MNTLLIMTVGQTDVQIVVENQRHKLDGNTCGTLHDAIKERSWSVVNAPSIRSRDLIKTLPDGEVKLCTPKLDAVLARIGNVPPTSALIFETNRQDAPDPRLAGEVLEHRLRDCDVENVTRVAFLTGDEQLEDPSSEVDAVVRRTVVATLSDAIGKQVEQLTKNDSVFVATTGGLAAANDLINELVRLHAVSGPIVTALEVPDRDRVQGEDVAVEEKFHPAAGYRARWHALSLVEKGNLLGAWGAVSHLEGAPGQEWTQVVKWLAQFASALPFDPPLPTNGELAVLKHPRMAVRAALRVELALCAGDIPRAVHGTVAFFESALWDKLLESVKRSPDPKKRKFFKFRKPPAEDLVRERDAGKLAESSKTKQREDRERPFIFKETVDGSDWYWIDDSEICAIKIAKHYLELDGLTRLGQALAGDVRELRNDVAHNDPTPTLMNEARTRMQTTQLWSRNDTFLSEPLVQDVLKELGELHPAQLCDNLLSTVRKRLRTIA